MARGTSVMTISPVEGTEEIDNPFSQNENRINSSKPRKQVGPVFLNRVPYSGTYYSHDA